MELSCIILFLINAWFIECRIYNISGYTYYPTLRGYLSYHSVPKNWNEARLQCFQEGGVLASPSDENVLSLLKKETAAINRCGPIHTGISTTISDGSVYVSVEGVPLSGMPVKWSSDEPDNFNDTEQCIILLPNGSIADYQCNSSFPYICHIKEGPGTPECNTHYPGYVLDLKTKHCYKFHNVAMNWIQASSRCLLEGAYLLLINSAHENIVASQIIAKMTNNNKLNIKGIWLGFRSWNMYGLWATVKGDILESNDYQNWSDNEPNNGGNNQYCGSMYTDGKWDDYQCHAVAKYICEMELE